MTELKRHLAVVDVERDAVFAVVTDDYELVTNQAAFELAGMVMRKVFHTTSMQDMVCFNLTMPKTRSFCHIDLIRRGCDFSPWDQDKWTAFLRISNSYNRTRLLRFELGFCRWICMNGMIFGRKSIEFSYSHTRRGVNKVDRFDDNIGDIRKLEAELIEALHQLKRYYVPESRMLPILCRAFDVEVDDSVQEKSRRTHDLREMRAHVKVLTHRYFSEMGPHGYAALNVLTDFASRPIGVISPEAMMHGYQQKTGEWMDEFVSAIKDPSFTFEKYLGRFQKSAEIIEAL